MHAEGPKRPSTQLPARAVQANFPADFVAEGIDQTRGWFYTLMVLSTALFDKPTFKHLVCNGLVLAADGKKMSKRLKNYPVRPQALTAKCALLPNLASRGSNKHHLILKVGVKYKFPLTSMMMKGLGIRCKP